MKIAIVIILCIVLSQLIKFILDGMRYGFSSKSLIKDGGFPSTHSTLVSGLSAAVYFEQGFSILFFVAATFAIIVCVDANRARKEIGDEAKAINKIIIKEKMFFPRLFEGEGHTLGQVMGGVVFGIVIALIIYGV
jgi:uncharacterized protein